MRNNRFIPSVEVLETRLVPYALSGVKWAALDVSASIMPDQTMIGTQASNVFTTYNAMYATQTWEAQFARALQTWASVTPLNFHFVGDSGAALGTAGPVQGNANFGDIRLGGFNSTGYALASTYYPYSTTTRGGDITLNDSYKFNIGSSYDLYSLLLHESGHAIGLAHSTVSTSVMYPYLTGVYTGLQPDDIAGAQAIYGARKADIYDAQASNDTLATATLLSLNSTGGMTLRADLTTMTDVDNYQLTVPAGSDGTLTVTLDPSQISLMIPKLSLFNASGQLITSATATTYGSVVSVTLTGLTAGQTYTIQANGATSDVFHIGSYILNAQFGGFGAAPYTTAPNTTLVSATASGGSVRSANAMPLPGINGSMHQNDNAELHGLLNGNTSTTNSPTFSQDQTPLASHHGIETALDHAAKPDSEKVFHGVWSDSKSHDQDASADWTNGLASTKLTRDPGAEGGGDAA